METLDRWRRPATAAVVSRALQPTQTIVATALGSDDRRRLQGCNQADVPDTIEACNVWQMPS